VARASDSQCRIRNGPGFGSGILRSDAVKSEGRQMKQYFTVELSTYIKNPKIPPFKYLKKNNKYREAL
jgi:hypothetical protein